MSFIFESDEAYNAREGLRATILKEILRSPAHAKEMMTNPKPPTDAMVNGTLVHKAILQPNLLEKMVVSPKFDRRTNAGKAAAADFEATNVGKEIVDQETMDLVKGCVDKIYSHPVARAALSEGKAEQTILWQEDGLDFKARPDFFTNSIGVELKTARDASPRGFARQAGSLKYALQAAHYLRGLSHVLGEKHDTFLFVCVETTAPYAVAVYELDQESLKTGRAQWDRAVASYQECIKTGNWPGYSQSVQMLTIIDWGD